ncbi:hypothetical protein ACX80U_12125 [Arthrobacter sp. TmT3-37]
MHDRPKFRLLRGDGESIRGIARSQGASRNAVRRALDPNARDHYHRSTLAEEAEPAVRDVLADYPAMSVADIAVMIDWHHSRRALSGLVAALRPEYLGRSSVDAQPIGSIRSGLLTTKQIQCGTMQIGEVKIQ